MSSGSRTSPDSLGEAGEAALGFMRLVEWLLKPPEPLAMQTHEPKMKVVPSLSTVGSKLKEPTEVYPKVVDCRQGLAKIRMRWCKEYKYLDRFRPPERNILRLVWLFCIALEVDD